MTFPRTFGRASNLRCQKPWLTIDRKSTRLNSSHSQISYAVFCLKKKKPPQVDRDTLSNTQLNHMHVVKEHDALRLRVLRARKAQLDIRDIPILISPRIAVIVDA